MAEKASAAVDHRRMSNLRIFARYLAEHPNEVHFIPKTLLPNHVKYFQRCLEYFRATKQHCPPCQDFFHCISGEPIIVIWMMMNKLDHPCEITGENSTVIRFSEEPLSSQLWITGTTEKPKGYCRMEYFRIRILLHTSNSAQQIMLNGTADLISIFGDIAAFQATFTSNPLDITPRIDLQAAEPKRHADDALLKTLGSLKYQQGQAGFAFFTEAARLIQQQCLLDAIMELFRLFIGLVPHFDTRWVHFHPTSSRESVKEEKCETFVNI